MLTELLSLRTVSVTLVKKENVEIYNTYLDFINDANTMQKKLELQL